MTQEQQRTIIESITAALSADTAVRSVQRLGPGGRMRRPGSYFDERLVITLASGDEVSFAIAFVVEENQWKYS